MSNRFSSWADFQDSVNRHLPQMLSGDIRPSGLRSIPDGYSLDYPELGLQVHIKWDPANPDRLLDYGEGDTGAASVVPYDRNPGWYKGDAPNGPRIGLSNYEAARVDVFRESLQTPDLSGSPRPGDPSAPTGTAPPKTYAPSSAAEAFANAPAALKQASDNVQGE